MSPPDILTLLANLMQTSGMSHDALSKAAEVRRATVSEILSGKQKPKASTLDALLGVFGYTLAGIKKEWAGSGALAPKDAKKQPEKPDISGKTHLSAQEAAAYFGITPPRVYHLLKAGRFPGAVKTADGFRIPVGEVVGFKRNKPGKQARSSESSPASPA